MSPNGRLLAYFTYRGRSGSVAVLDLATGRVRSVNVDAAVGHGHVLAEIQPGWTRDSSMVVLATGSTIKHARLTNRRRLLPDRSLGAIA